MFSQQFQPVFDVAAGQIESEMVEAELLQASNSQVDGKLVNLENVVFAEMKAALLNVARHSLEDVPARFKVDLEEAQKVIFAESVEESSKVQRFFY